MTGTQSDFRFPCIVESPTPSKNYYHKYVLVRRLWIRANTVESKKHYFQLLGKYNRLSYKHGHG